MNSKDYFDQQTTPFISSDSYLAESETEDLMQLESNLIDLENDTPFLSVYEFDGFEEETNLEEEEATELIAELYDEELNQALYELTNEASEIYEAELESEFNTNSDLQRASLQHQLTEEYSSLFSKELDYFFDSLTGALEEEDVSGMNDSEIDSWVDKHITDYETHLEEYIEEESPFEYGLFSKIKKGFKKVKQKVKNVAKKVVKKVAKVVKKTVKKVKSGIKKGVKAIKKGARFLKNNILKRVIKKLKKYIVRFFKKVMNSNLVKKHLPSKYRELFILIQKAMNSKRAKKVGRKAWKNVRKRIGGKGQRELETYFDEYAYLQQELDFNISDFLDAETEVEEDRLVENYEQEDYYPDEEILRELETARSTFVQEMGALQEGEDPSPHVEHFVTAILQAIRVVLRPIVAAYGRNKTINNIIAPLLYKILRKFIKGKGKKSILKSVSRILGDIGLKVLLKMEVSEEMQQETAADAVANIAEETMSEIIQLPQYVFEDDELAQAFTMETFEKMAGANLPPILPESQYLANPELRESAVKGSWVAYRSRKRKKRKHCKKYSKIFRKKLSPHLMKEIKTFGETSLAEFLNERMDLSVNQEVEANIHLYEALNEAGLYQVSQAEENIPAFNIESEFGYQLLHPLTPLNAGLLLGEPGLGRKTNPVFLSTPTLIRPGQRFFYLEINNARPKVITDNSGMAYLRRLSVVNQSFNFIRNQIKINVFISERKAQEIATKLRSGSSYGSALAQLLKTFDSGLKTAMSPIMIHRRTRIIHPLLVPGPDSGLEFSKLVPEYIQELFKDQLMLWSARAFGSFIKQNGQAFIAATEDEQDGVTLLLNINNPPGFSTIKRILSNHSLNISQDFLEGKPEEVTVKIKPGFYY